MTFGFQTAVQICTDAIDRLHTTAESHDRVMVVEVMGRHAGHIAVWAGLAGGATMTLIPEEPFDIDAVCDSILRRHESGRYASIVVVAEGAVPVPGTLVVPEPEIDEYGHQRLGGIGTTIGGEIERRTGYETRVTILGHVQRGGTPVAFDRVLASRYGVAAIDAVHDGAYGDMVCLSAGIDRPHHPRRGQGPRSQDGRPAALRRGPACSSPGDLTQVVRSDARTCRMTDLLLDAARRPPRTSSTPRPPRPTRSAT